MEEQRVLIEIFLVYLVYLFLVLAGTYYVTMFNSKDVYTKEEIKNVFPYIFLCMTRINALYPITVFFAVMIVSSFIGVIIPLLVDHWIANSSLLFIILFFGLPVVRKILERSYTDDPDTITDALAGLVVKFMEVIILGFGAGQATALIYNWRSLPEIHSLFFLVNIVIISIFIGNIINILVKE